MNLLSTIQGELSICIFTLEGKLLKELRTLADREIFHIYVGDLDAGVYIIITEDPSGEGMAEKLVVE